MSEQTWTPQGPWYVSGPHVRKQGTVVVDTTYQWEVTNGDCQIARCDVEDDAQRIADALNAVEMPGRPHPLPIGVLQGEQKGGRSNG